MVDSEIRVGVDVGGTFTDVAVSGPGIGGLTVAKVLTTPSDLSQAIIRGIEEALSVADVVLSDVKGIVHGTTLIANTIIERKGSTTGLITTKGFRDVLEMGRETRYDPRDLFAERLTPLVPRRLRFGIAERRAPDGTPITALDMRELEAALDVMKRADVRSVAIVFLHSYADPANELAAAEVIASQHPELAITPSVEVTREIGEYERASTTLANAYVKPLVSGYLSALDKRLRQLGFAGRFQLMLSSGGTTSVDSAARFPIRLVESGPAAGVVIARENARLAGCNDAIAFDMGGTTAKLCIMPSNVPGRVPETEVARMRRFTKGSGIPLKVSTINVIEIGAGGGSIAHIDQMGLMKVGPESAGASPGPACYALGGEQPTVTDADLVLGYLGADEFLGGAMKLSLEKARSAIETHLGQRLGMEVVKVAAGIKQVADESMARAARVHAAEQGCDLRGYTLIATGGAGPVHAYEVGRLLGVSRIVYPSHAGVASAVGLLLAGPRIDLGRALVRSLDAIDIVEVVRLYAEMEEEAADVLRDGGVSPNAISWIRTVDMRYVGQGSEIGVPLPESEPSEWTKTELGAAFQVEYERSYQRRLSNVPIEAIHWRLTGYGPDHPLGKDVNSGGADAPGESSPTRTRKVYFHELDGGIECPVYYRADLQVAARIVGPAIVQERESTIVLGPKARGLVHDSECFIATL